MHLSALIQHPCILEPVNPYVLNSNSESRRQDWTEEWPETCAASQRGQGLTSHWNTWTSWTATSASLQPTFPWHRYLRVGYLLQSTSLWLKWLFISELPPQSTELVGTANLLLIKTCKYSVLRRPGPFSSFSSMTYVIYCTLQVKGHVVYSCRVAEARFVPAGSSNQ